MPYKFDQADQHKHVSVNNDANVSQPVAGLQHFPDNRPKAVNDRKLHSMMKNSSQQGSGQTGTSAVLQAVWDFQSSGVSAGTGLTETQQGDYGKWHIHIISDDEGLGLINSVFIKFEERGQGDQHLMFNQDGKMQPTNLSKTGPQELVAWGVKQVQELLATCTVVSPEEIEQRRVAKAEKEQKAQENLAKLPPKKEVVKHDYSGGSQAGLFGDQAPAAVGPDIAKKMVEKTGLAENHMDYAIVLAKVKEGLPKEKWPTFIRQYYDTIYS